MSRPRKRIVVAMSGGVDSSVAAALLRKNRYEGIAVSIKLWPKEECGYHRPTSCCSLESISDARLVAEMLDIPFYVIDLHREFKKEIMDYFDREYLSGRTPNPCILCNERIKFGALVRKAEEPGAGYVATGHYAGVGFDRKKKRFLLRGGRDKAKDQSYVLFSLTQQQLAKVVFPLANFTKGCVRALAKRMNFPAASKPESQDICFVHDDYTKYLSKKFKEQIRPGPIVDEDGKRLGTHRGVPFYTIGQREGLGIAHSHALYVVRIDKKDNTIVVGPKEARYFRRMVIGNLNWIVEPVKERLEAWIKIRSQHKKARGRIRLTGETAVVEFKRRQESPAPGQAAVFYNGEIVIGGGWIESATH